MGQDARVRYTKMMIQVNFVSLLKQKPLNKITVKEICEAAEINRATFYRYYLDVFDLMEQLEGEILEELQQTLQIATQQDVHKTLVVILEKMKQNGALYSALFSSNGDPGFPLKIFQTCYAETASYIKAQYPNLDEVRQAWVYVFAAQGSSGILSYWINDGMIEPPEQVADMVETLIVNTLEGLEKK